MARSTLQINGLALTEEVLIRSQDRQGWAYKKGDRLFTGIGDACSNFSIYFSPWPAKLAICHQNRYDEESKNKGRRATSYSTRVGPA
ncbi:MAG: hypothetical protein F6J93_31470 [Oscillatoria sp. SIO1A7]|nr:hypothetical protein [Oscillatoria sp. SIO1A7]